MLNSGSILDFSDRSSLADKHSTGALVMERLLIAR